MTSTLQLNYEAAAASAERQAHNLTRMIAMAEAKGLGTHPAVKSMEEQRQKARVKAGDLYTAALIEFNRNQEMV